MYRGFKLQIEPNSYLPYQEIGHNLFDQQQYVVRPILQKYILSDDVINGTQMQENWFPQMDAHVFISHSHQDSALAQGLAGWLHETFGIKAFVDSTIWGYAEDLLRLLDNKFCLQDGGPLFDYQRRNYSTAHVYMMLQNALSKMIDSCESIFFLNTPNSTVESIIKTSTNSPWIYSELSLTALIRKKTPQRFLTEINKSFSEQQRSLLESHRLKIEYQLDLGHLISLTTSDIVDWKHNCTRLLQTGPTQVLDQLYQLKPL